MRLLREYHLDIEPIQQERARRAGPHSKHKMYNPQAQLKKTVKFLFSGYEDEPLIEGPVYVKAYFWFKPPESWSQKKKSRALGLASPKIYHSSKPDKDNLEKFLNDVLDGTILKNDCQIYGGEQLKDYREEPGIDVYIYTPYDN